MFYSLATRPVFTPVHRARNYAPLVSNRALDRFLDDTLTSLAGSASPTGPAADVQDADDAYKLQLDAPGLTKEQLDIGIEGNIVRIASKADAPRKLKAAWQFPLDIDLAASSAKLENGVLDLVLGKKKPVSNVSTLAIS